MRCISHQHFEHSHRLKQQIFPNITFTFSFRQRRFLLYFLLNCVQHQFGYHIKILTFERHFFLISRSTRSLLIRNFSGSVQQVSLFGFSMSVPSYFLIMYTRIASLALGVSNTLTDVRVQILSKTISVLFSINAQSKRYESISCLAQI